MTYLRGSTGREHAALRQGDLWDRRAELPVPGRSIRGGIAGFFRAAGQTLSLSVMRAFARELQRRDPLLSSLSWSLVAVIPAFAVMAFIAPDRLQLVNPWIKPIKFSLSFSTFASTISIFLLTLRLPDGQLKAARRTIAASISLEIFSLAAQAWRRAYAPETHTAADSMLALLTNSMVMVSTAVVCWMLGWFCAGRVRSQMVDGPMLAAIRSSIVIFLFGNAVGGYMLARGSHAVGVAPGGPGLPFLNWSTVAGDLRIAHFIALHAIQIVPLFAFVLAQMTPVLPVRRRRRVIAIVAFGVAVAVGTTFVQAALGRPLLSLH